MRVSEFTLRLTKSEIQRLLEREYGEAHPTIYQLKLNGVNAYEQKDEPGTVAFEFCEPLPKALGEVGDDVPGRENAIGTMAG